MFALVDGRPVDQFLGALPEAEVAAFVAKLVPEEEETELQRLLREGDETALAPRSSSSPRTPR